MIPALFNYFGGKGRLSAHYPPPRHDLIVEVCAGGAGYARRHHDHPVLLVDVDPKVCSIWRFLIRATKDEIMSIPLMYTGQSIDDVDVSPEARLYLSACVNTTPFRKRLTAFKNGHNTGLWGADMRRRVADSVHLIKHWRVMCCSYEDLGNAEATWFVDPPYEGALSSHYAASVIDYLKLAEFCRSRQGQVIVCEKMGATWLPFRFLTNARAMSRTGDGNRRSEEAYWLNDWEKEDE